MLSQKLYKLHYEFFDFRQCKWFFEVAEALRRQQAVQAIRAIQQELQQVQKARIVKEARQQQVDAARIAKEKAARIAKEKAARLIAEAFACRRCPAKFASNIKLHDHVRTKHTKKSASFISLTSPAPLSSFTSSIFSPVFSPTTSRKSIS